MCTKINDFRSKNKSKFGTGPIAWKYILYLLLAVYIRAVYTCILYFLYIPVFCISTL